MMEKEPCIAVIGCGGIATQAHFPAFQKIGGVRVKYACDLIPERADAMKNTYDFVEQAITDYHVALADPEVEAVYILTHNYSHYEITMDALKAGKHVFCEKPITVDYKRSEEMAKAAKKSGKLLNIGVCNRYLRSVELLEEMNRNGRFGKIYHVYCSFRDYRCIPGLGGDFTTKASSGGGVLIDWGVHFIDLILYILGGAKMKTATCDAYSEMAKDMKEYRYVNMWAAERSDIENGTNDVEDYVSGYVRTDKASISFNGCWAQNIGETEMYIDFLGDKGGARLRYGDKFTFWTTSEEGVLEKVDYFYNQERHYDCEDRAFLEAIKTGEHTRSHVDNVLETAKILDALYESARTGKELSF